ncbi:sulfite exporter TauE/SafE family protein [Streptomyces yunnanensis]|uniref:Probable membrane transporter protein n=1 Tax=Streptomyces yunnanensis TaxID=156453 RepID=A0ABY8AAT6_9ACTN|nr:sulfite exporter TauE/SafE family protein [Streptomyces yunnanensis]WEB42110.1 sulfite exporter TauE/SafE family protein [Streptomyces yunnanensis]
MSVLIAVTALPCGLLIGLLLGALGGGGSVLAVPALVYLLGQSPHAATAGALVVVAVGAVSGLACHARAGRVRWVAGAAFGALGTAGSFTGSRWSASVPPGVLMAAFSGLMLVVAVGMVMRGNRGNRDGRRAAAEETGAVAAAGAAGTATAAGSVRPAEPERSKRSKRPERSKRPREWATGAVSLWDAVRTSSGRRTAARASRDSGAGSHRTRPLRTVVTASAVGLLTGFFGVGGGFVVVPALTLVLGLEMPVAVGTSLLVILINSGAALATRAGTGSLDWPLLATLAACAAAGSSLGNRLAGQLRPQTLTTSFAALVTVLALAMAATTLPSL